MNINKILCAVVINNMGNYITQISEINTDNIFNNCINSLISCDNNNKLETLLSNTIQPDVCVTQPNIVVPSEASTDNTVLQSTTQNHRNNIQNHHNNVRCKPYEGDVDPDID